MRFADTPKSIRAFLQRKANDLLYRRKRRPVELDLAWIQTFEGVKGT